MFHRVIGLSSVLLGCLVGCSHHGHRDSGCCHHGHHHGDSGNLNAVCGDGEACTCSAPLYPGDHDCHGKCRKHDRQKPMQRMATAFRRSSSRWISSRHTSGCECESCNCDPYISQPMMWEQHAVAQPVWGVPQTCGCDSCAISMTDGWTDGGVPITGGYYAATDPGSSACGCGEQNFTDGSMHIPEGNGPYEYSVESPMMTIPDGNPGNAVQRSFPPSPSLQAPGTPGSLNNDIAKPLPIPPADQGAVPMPQDMTPMDPPMEFPGNAAGEFNPPGGEGAPPADKVLDPVSFEVPRLPPIPERANSSGKRAGPQEVRPIATRSQQWQR